MTKLPPPAPKRPPGRYCYEGFWTLHWGVVGDEFWLKLRAREARKEQRAQKRAQLWARIRSWF